MSAIQNLFRNIKFWLLLFFLIRLIGITNPPLEIAHNWRQSTVTMVARNFYEIDNNIFYPRIDIAGEKTGITGMEFPILNYLIYLTAKVFGYQHWYGRLINLIISSIGIFMFFKLLRKYFEENIAFAATIVLLSSLWFSYSRKIMPDTFSVSFIIAAIYYGTNYLEGKLDSLGLRNILFYFLCVIIGSLSKLPAAYLLIVLLVLMLNNKVLLKNKLIFVLVSLFSILPAAFWYFYWVPYLVDKFGFWHFFMGKGIEQGASEIYHNLNLTLDKFYDAALKYVGFTIFLIGIFKMIEKRNQLLLAIFILSLPTFLIIIFKSGVTFSTHSYYIIPFIPVMALLAGYGLSKIANMKIKIVLLAAIILEGVLNQQHDFRIHDKEMALTQLEYDLDKVSFRRDLILINSGDYPTPMYFAHRKGWVATNDKIENVEYLNSLKLKGLKFIIILKKSFGENINLNHKIILDNEDYCIYKM
jgi:4-amino-4-deoxy-L-arabinose transferase-like glycosyltransferase